MPQHALVTREHQPVRDSPLDFRQESGNCPLGFLQEAIAMREATPADVLRGTLDLLVLKTLTLEPMHGWGISQRIQQMSKNVLDVNQGSLYPALQRLELKEWIDSEWRASDNNRRAKYYRLTAKGRRALGAETESWRRYVDAVEDILATQ
jgi:PadR family transcriptional regulator PadR